METLTRKRSSLTGDKTGPCGVEVTLLQAQNVPQKPVLAIRAGNALRHVDLNVNDPFRIPVRDFKDGGPVNVSLYQQLGTQQILDVDELESICSVPVRIHDGSFSQVKLRVRRGRPVSMANLLGSPADVEEYFGTHQLEAHIQRLFEIVLKTQPADPYQCMIEELRKIKEKDVATRGPRQPKVPHPPSSQPTTKQRPSALKSRSRLRLSESSQDTFSPHAHLQSSVQPELPNVEELSNRELTREFLRRLFRCLGEKMATQLTFSGGKQNDSRMLSIEACYHVRRMVFEACSQRRASCEVFEIVPQTSEACLQLSGAVDVLLPLSEETSDLLAPPLGVGTDSSTQDKALLSEAPPLGVGADFSTQVPSKIPSEADVKEKREFTRELLSGALEVLDAELAKSRSPSPNKDQSSTGSPNRELTSPSPHRDLASAMSKGSSTESPNREPTSPSPHRDLASAMSKGSKGSKETH